MMAFEKQKGTFVISLDFELLWGFAGCSTSMKENANRAYKMNVVPRLLELFERYGIHATWATVGAMMAENEVEFKSNLPEMLPNQTRCALSEFGFSEELCVSEEQSRKLFAPEWVKLVSSTPGQELASHTYTHYYCDLPESTPEQFGAELFASKRIAAEKYSPMQSLVFPRNQVETEFLNAAREQGFYIYRGKETNAEMGGLFWYMNHYLPLKKCSYALQEIEGNGCFNVKSSRFYKPYRRKYALLEPLKVKRYQRELIQAAKDGEVYHIYWHPHNFAQDTEKNFSQLERVLKCYQKANALYGMQSLNMKETVEKYRNLRAIL